MPELEAILTAAQEKEKRTQRFMAALKGIDLDKGQDEAAERFEAVKRRVAAKKEGKSEEQLMLEEMGIDIETN